MEDMAETQEESANSVWLKLGWQGDALGTHPTREWKFSTVVILTDTSTSSLETTQANNLAAESNSRSKKKALHYVMTSPPPSRGYRNFHTEVLSGTQQKREKEIAIKKLAKMRKTASNNKRVGYGNQKVKESLHSSNKGQGFLRVGLENV